MKDRITRILERWFLQDPELFSRICTYEFVEDTGISRPFVLDNVRILYNTAISSQMDDSELAGTLMTETLGIEHKCRISCPGEISGTDVIMNFEKAREQIKKYTLPQLCALNEDIYKTLCTGDYSEKEAKVISANIEKYFDGLINLRNGSATHFTYLQTTEGEEYEYARRFIARYCKGLTMSMICYCKSIKLR